MTMPPILPSAGIAPEIAVAAIPGDERVWVPQAPDVWFRPLLLNTVAGVGRIRMDEVTRGMLPFMWAEFAMLFLMVLFPSLVTVPAKWFIY